MSFMTTIRAAVLPALATVAGLGWSAAQAQETTWRVQSHWPSSSSSYADSLERIAGILEERTEGRLTLQLHEAGALVPAEDIFDAVSRGVVQMGTISPAYVRDKIEVAGIASGLPFAFREVWEVAYFHQSLGLEQALRDGAAEYGVYYATDKVYPTEMVVKAPIQSMEDFEGLKIRSSGALQEFLTAAGAAASYVPGPELYPALATGVMDGAHWGASQGASSMGLYEVAKFHVLPPLNIAGTDAFVINQDALDALSEEDRGTVIDALEEQFWFRTNQYQYQERIALAEAIANQEVQVNQLPEAVLSPLTEVARERWDAEAEKGEVAAQMLDGLKGFLSDLGHIEPQG